MITSRRCWYATVVAGVVVIAVAPCAGAQGDTPVAGDTARFDPVVVTGNKVATEQAASTLSTSVITGDELRAHGIGTVLEALKAVPGADVAQSGSFGAVTSLFLRGGESDYVKVLVDGVPVNDPGGSFDFAHLTTDNVDRIEIVRGPSSVLYGSDAVTGVIQIFTRNGARGVQGEVAARGGTYSTVEYDGSVLGGSDRAGFSLSGARHTTDGVYTLNNRYENNTLSGAVRFAPSARSDVELTSRYTDGVYHFPTTFTGEPTDINQYHTDKRLSFGADGGVRFSPLLEGRLLLANTDIDTRSANPPDSSADGSSYAKSQLYRRSAEARLIAHIRPDIAATGGVEYSKQHDEEHSDFFFPGFGDSADSSQHARENIGYYGELVGSAAGRMSYTAGVRLDDNQRFGNFFTYRVGGGVRIAAHTRLRAAVGTAFKEPTFEEQFAQGFSKGNPDLQPERSTSWEVGAEQDLANGRLTLGATYFDQRFRDLVQYYTPGDTALPNYVNIAAANARGAELQARVSPVDPLLITANFTVLHSEVVDAGHDEGSGAVFVDGSRLLRRPTYTANLDARYRFGRRALLGTHVNYVGNRDDRDFTGLEPRPVVLPAYVKVDLFGELPVLSARPGRPGVALTLRVDNLFDAEYQAIYGYPAPGITVLGGIRAEIGL
jgi:vitamin B12 transporter